MKPKEHESETESLEGGWACLAVVILVIVYIILVGIELGRIG